jgi:hypothetical protein
MGLPKWQKTQGKESEQARTLLACSASKKVGAVGEVAEGRVLG